MMYWFVRSELDGRDGSSTLRQQGRTLVVTRHAKTDPRSHAATL